MHTSNDFKRLAKFEKDIRTKIRLLALFHFKQGASRTQIAHYLGVNRGSVNSWVSNYLSQGLEGLKSKRSPGRPINLTMIEQQDVLAFVHANAVKPDGGRLIADDVRLFILEKFDVDYKLNSIYRLLHSLGLSWITSRSKHPKQSQEVQEAFKKIQIGNDPSHAI